MTAVFIAVVAGLVITANVIATDSATLSIDGCTAVLLACQTCLTRGAEAVTTSGAVTFWTVEEAIFAILEVSADSVATGTGAAIKVTITAVLRGVTDTIAAHNTRVVCAVFRA